MVSSLPCSCTFYGSIPTEKTFFQKLFSLFPVLFPGVYKPTFKQLQLVSPLNIMISHCRRTRLSIATNVFRAGDKHVSHRRRTLLAQETNLFYTGTNILVNEINALKTRIRSNLIKPNTHTASYQQLPNRTDLETIASHSYTHVRKRALCSVVRLWPDYMCYAWNT